MYENDADRDAAANYNDPQQKMDHYFYDEEEYDDYFEEDYVPDGLYEGRNFPPSKPTDWDVIPTTQLPGVSIDMARGKFWDHGKKEIEFFLNKITELRDKYRHNDVLDNVVHCCATATVTCTKRSEKNRE